MCPDLGLWLVADGMGGCEGGEIASAIASYVITHHIKFSQQASALDRLLESIQAAHAHIVQYWQHHFNNPHDHIGTTIVALYGQNNYYTVAWAGDSRAYKWNASTHVLTCLTKDHSLMQDKLDSGQLTPENCRSYPFKNVITRALGTSSRQSQVDIDSRHFTWESKNEYILLCSDGLHDYISNQKMGDILAQYHPNSDQQLFRLTEAALINGGQDNITVVLVKAPNGIQPSTESSSPHDTFDYEQNES